MNELRVLKEAEYIICAKVFRVSKSTVHYDITKHLFKINESLYYCVVDILNFNLTQRHIRGGIATKQKYKGAKHE